MSKIFLLSICIPTYNFGPYIGDTIKSITDQLSENIEIVIYDGGSTDNTAEVVLKFKQQFPQIAYHRVTTKGGIDKDMAATVDLARGEYCWLLSSDDALKPGAIQRILNEFKDKYDVYLCNRTECDRFLAPIKDNHWLPPSVNDRVIDFSKTQETIDYFNLAISIGALFSYMSSIIFRRSKWMEIHNSEKFNGSNYAHVFRLFSILQKEGSLKYIREPLILCRGENDSFMAQGLFKRSMLDLDGYHQLALALFPDQHARSAFLGVIRRIYSWRYFISLKKMAPDGFNWKDLERKLLDYGYKPAQLRAVNIISSRFIHTWAKQLLRLINQMP